MAFNNVSNWVQTMTENSVQPDARTTGADFLSSETVVLCSGPRKLHSYRTPDGSSSLDINPVTDLVPIGLVQNVQFAQQKQIQQIYEVGSRTPLFIPGRTVISAAISRILFDGPSLMQAMYFQSAEGNAVKLSSWHTGVSTAEPHDAPTLPISQKEQKVIDKGSQGATGPNPGQFFINLASSFFNRPMGLGFIMYDGEKDPYGAFYLEDVYIQTHNLSIASQQTVLVENVSLRTSALVPIDVSVFGKKS